MSKNTKRLNSNIKFFACLEALNLITSYEDGIVTMLISVGSLLFLIACLMMIKNNHEKGGIFCIILGLFELFAGIFYAVNYLSNFNIFTDSEKILVGIVPVVQLLIGIIVTYEAVKYNKELKGEK